MNPILSVIIPVYNGAHFILWQLQIINNQNFNNIEVLFVDNNSQDDSVVIIKNEINKAKWPFEILLLSEKKQGAGAARNKGLANARGEYVTFLDIDDEILPGKWEKDFSIFSKNPEIDFVFCKTKRIYEDGTEILHDINEIALGINYPPFLGKIWTNNYFKIQNTSSATIRRKAAVDIGGFEEAVRIGEDAMFFIKLGFQKIGYFYNEVFFHYMKRNTSTTIIRNQKRSPNLDNFTLRKVSIIPFYERVEDFEMVKSLKYQQIRLLRFLFIERIFDWRTMKQELLLLNIKVPLAVYLDLYLIRLTGLDIQHRYNPLLRIAAKYKI